MVGFEAFRIKDEKTIHLGHVIKKTNDTKITPISVIIIINLG